MVIKKYVNAKIDKQRKKINFSSSIEQLLSNGDWVGIIVCGLILGNLVIYVQVFVLPFKDNGILIKHFVQGKACLNLHFVKNVDNINDVDWERTDCRL